MNRKKYWEHFSHVADMGIRGVGNTVQEAFEMAAVALTAVITEPNHVTPQETILINLEAPTLEILLTDWINAIIFEMDTKNMIFSRFEINIENTHLSAKIYGEQVDIKKHLPRVQPKGATFTELKVAHENNLWIAQCIIDI